jgi:hypothetical protein
MFKYKKDYKRYYYLHPLIVIVLLDMHHYCISKNLPFTITSTVTTIEEDNELERVSTSHRTGRAFDLSIRGWDEYNISNFVSYFNDKYRDIAAYTFNTNKPMLVVDHVGTARHLHVQIHKKYSQNINQLAFNLTDKD